MTRVLICGGRDFVLYARGRAFLDAHHQRTPFSLVLIGLDPRRQFGADDMADRWAEERGIDRILFPPNWVLRGKGGGPHRNGLMISALNVDFQPEKVIGFQTGGPGTTDMLKRARAAGLEVVEARA
ncbi:DUF2493 domain-containing protein [Methylobacterium platani]|uniref:YspA cpYpsA-related SLOG domain-containing protein n=2 Tax=Methylobacterium platani TaxID=427683 RepID=A0A179SIB8_9HYPH|nr:DUF2493 domain-containing protein [Methylobacterium platani]KMO21407.1 hypothetical protein SQ03_03395 [Methylobacterium platani JCM 14648]OAS26313.1 hypothetical protein A5481_06255 [Methylobacterium platani]